MSQQVNSIVEKEYPSKIRCNYGAIIGKSHYNINVR